MMAAVFAELSEYLDGTLPIEVRGKRYTVDPIDAETGLRCQRLFAAGIAVATGGTPTETPELDDSDEADLYRRLLGTVYDEMVDDGVPWVQLRHAAITVMLYTVAGEDVALRFWQSGGSGLGEAEAPNRAARRQASRATASTTRKPASTSGTTSARTPRKTAARRGKTSSSTGD